MQFKSQVVIRLTRLIIYPISANQFNIYFQPNYTTSENKVYESFYSLDGKYIASGEWLNEKFYILHDKPVSSSNHRENAVECTTEENKYKYILL